MVICLERYADLHMAQLMPLPLTVSCFSKIQIGFAFLVPAHLGSPGKGAVKRVCVCVSLERFYRAMLCYSIAGFAVVVCPSVQSVRLSVCYKPVLYRNGWTNRAGYWHGGFLPSIPHCVIRKFGYLQKLWYFPLELFPKLPT